MNRKKFISGIIILVAGLVLAGFVLLMSQSNIPPMLLIILIIVNCILFIAGLRLCLGEIIRTVVINLKDSNKRQKAIIDKRHQARKNKDH